MSTIWYLTNELKRLSKINCLLEDKIEKADVIENEPERIANNVRAMCEIADRLF